MDKGKKRKKTFYNIIIFILICVIAYSLFMIGKILWGYYAGDCQYDNVASLAGSPQKGKINFEKLLEENEDVHGWLYLKDSKINYPVVKSTNNDYYLYRMYNKEYNSKGSLFIDYRDENPFEDFLTIIYGHRMKDGSMFHNLSKYSDEEFYKSHKIMDLYTPDQKYKVVIIGAMTIPADSSQYKFSFNEHEKASYIDWIKANNETEMDDVEVTPDDKIIMMSTCTADLDEGRFVVYGKLVPTDS